MEKPLISCSDEYIRFLRWIAQGEWPHRYRLFPEHMDTWDMRERMGHLLDIIEKPHHYKKEFEIFQEWEEEDHNE